MNFHEHLGHWETFYLLIGTAGATLAGLTFVAITAASGFASSGNIVGLRSHLDPSVVAFGMTLTLSCILLMPTLSAPLLGLVLLGGGLYLGGYTLFIMRQIKLLVSQQNAITRSYNYDLFDRVFYGVIPVTASLLLVLSGALIWLNCPEQALTVLGVTMLALLVMGIRNALDMLMLTLSRRPTAADQEQP